MLTYRPGSGALHKLYDALSRHHTQRDMLNVCRIGEWSRIRAAVQGVAGAFETGEFDDEDPPRATEEEVLKEFRSLVQYLTAEDQEELRDCFTFEPAPGDPNPDRLVYTVGQGPLSADQFITLLKTSRILRVVDVRPDPDKQRYAAFRSRKLRELCVVNGISYAP